MIAEEIDKLKKSVTEAVFASRGYSVDQPLAIVPRDLPNTFTDIAAGTLLANLCSSALVTAWFNGLELKHLLEFFLVDNPAHPGEFFPRVSGMRFRYDLSRPQYDAVTLIELGELERGYRTIDIGGKNQRLYSLSCPLMLGTFAVAIPKFTKGKLSLTPKNQAGQPFASRVEALDSPRRGTAQMMAPAGTTDKASLATCRREAPSAKSRNGRRSWITCAACRSRPRANFP